MGEASWGTLSTSMLTLFQTITNGVDWNQVYAPLSQIDRFWQFLFLLFLTFTYFAVLNVVTGAFCQGAIEGKQYDKEQFIQDLLITKKGDIEKITDVFSGMFQCIDSDGSGAISGE